MQTNPTVRALVQRALQCRHTRASFATLTRHADARHYDRNEALRLLYRNVRDADKRAPRLHSSVADRDKAAKELLAVWRASRDAQAATE